jgi:hypothetical protein
MSRTMASSSGPMEGMAEAYLAPQAGLTGRFDGERQCATSHVGALTRKGGGKGGR